MEVPPRPSDEPASAHGDGAPPAAPGGGECPRCGAAYAPGQEYCLECGLRLPVPGSLITTLGTAWQRRIPWYPGDWIWLALVGLVIAGISAGAAIAFSGGGGGGSGVVVATHPKPAPPVASDTTTTTIAPPPEQPTTPTTTRKTPPKPPPRTTLTTWPAGKSGYTVVLNSVPTTSGRALAAALAQKALRAGLQQVGVLDAARYSSFHPGYYVVFSGIYSTQAAAASAASSAHGNGYSDAYPKPVTQ